MNRRSTFRYAVHPVIRASFYTAVVALVFSAGLMVGRLS